VPSLTLGALRCLKFVYFSEDDITFLHENEDLRLTGQEITSFALLCASLFYVPHPGSLLLVVLQSTRFSLAHIWQSS